MLTLIGLGLFNEKDLTLQGLEEAKRADKIYIELYTSIWHGSLQNLEKLVGREIEVLRRKDLEENSEKILEEARVRNVAVFVQGDPLVQTTHSALVSDARKRGIETKIIHNASIISAIAETGLHPQKFGPYVTIPFPEKTKGRLPESVYEVIKMNRARGLHTLCLLDVDEEQKKFMSVKEALTILSQVENMRREGVFSPDMEIVVFAKAGSEKPAVLFGKAENLVKRQAELPAVLVIPGMLHFTEREALGHANL